MAFFKAACLVGISFMALSEDIVTDSVTVDVLGQSGKIRMYGTDAGRSDPNLVTIEMDAMRELDTNGETVGSSGQERHSIQNFASQDFTFHNLVSDVLMGTNASIHASAHRLSFESTIGDVGSIAVDTFVITKEGLVGPESEQWNAGVGDMKFNIRFPNWKWCGDADANCRGGDVGEYLELDLKMKGNLSQVTLVPGTVNTYDLGGGANLTLTDFVMIDGQEDRMAPGYPQMLNQGGSQIFRFRFPKFTSSADYDPLLRQGWHWGHLQQAISDFNSADGSLISASVPGSLFSILTALLVVIGFVYSF